MAGYLDTAIAFSPQCDISDRSDQSPAEPTLLSHMSLMSQPQEKQNRCWLPMWRCSCKPDTTNGGEFVFCWFCGAARPADDVGAFP
ncbi:hypothetical protein BH24CHL4_BH24CHL4_19530 [soil metagenome]